MGHIYRPQSKAFITNVYSPNPGAMRYLFSHVQGKEVIVIFKYNGGTYPIQLPENGIVYTPNTIYGQGSIIGVNNGTNNDNTWCVFKGILPYATNYAKQLIVTGLVSRTSYRVEIYECNDTTYDLSWQGSLSGAYYTNRKTGSTMR